MEEATNVVQLAGLSKAIAIAIGGGLPAIAIGMIAKAAMKAIGRNPEAAPKIQGAMILSVAFAEAIAIYALITVILIGN